MEPPPPSYNEAVTNPNHYTSTSIDDESEVLGSAVDPVRDAGRGFENSQFDDNAESNALLESEDTTQRNISSPGTPPRNVGESHFGTGGRSYISGESHFSTSGSPNVSGAPSLTGEPENRTTGSPSGDGAPTQTGESQYINNGSSSGSGAPTQTRESQYITNESSSGSGAPPQTGESQYITNGSSSDYGAPPQTGESQYRANGSSSGYGEPPQAGQSQYITNGSSSGSGAPPQTGESQYRATGSSSGYGEPPQTGESQYITNGSSSDYGAPPQTGESQYRANRSSSGYGEPPQAGESQYITNGSSSVSGTSLQTRQVQSTQSAQPELSESSAQSHPPPPSYSEAFIRPGQARNNMQISRSALSGAHRNPIIDPEQPPPPYSAVVSSQGSRYYPPVNAPTLNSSYATQPFTSGINRNPAERTYGSGSQGSYNKQGYQRMPHGSYIPVIRNTNEQSGLTAPSTGTPGNVQGYNTTPLAYVDPNSVPQEKTNTCGKLCTLCVCVALIFVPLIIYLMLLN